MGVIEKESSSTLNKLEIETPAILVDLDIMEKNIKTMTDFTKTKNVGLRAHFKTPKTPAIAWKELRAGAVGVCCQKLGEAEVCATAGIDDILITHQVVEPQKIDRLIRLTKHVRDLKVNVDNPIHVRALSEAARKRNARLGVIVELDLRPVGGKECGVPPGKEAVALAKQVSESAGLEFRGIQGYAGYLNFLDQREGIEKKRLECGKVNEMVLSTRDMIEDAGISVGIITGSGTGSYKFQYEAFTELQSGSFVLMDWVYNISAPEFEIALSVLATVVNTRRDLNTVMTDCGWKAISVDGGMPKVKDRPDLKYVTSGDEHGRVETTGVAIGLNLLDKIELYTSHVCTTVNLHDRMYGIRGDEVEVVWPILARGKYQ